MLVIDQLRIVTECFVEELEYAWPRLHCFLHTHSKSTSFIFAHK